MVRFTLILPNNIKKYVLHREFSSKHKFLKFKKSLKKQILIWLTFPENMALHKPISALLHSKPASIYLFEFFEIRYFWQIPADPARSGK